MFIKVVFSLVCFLSMSLTASSQKNVVRREKITSEAQCVSIVEPHAIVLEYAALRGEDALRLVPSLTLCEHCMAAFFLALSPVPQSQSQDDKYIADAMKQARGVTQYMHTLVPCCKQSDVMHRDN